MTRILLLAVLLAPLPCLAAIAGTVDSNYFGPVALMSDAGQGCAAGWHRAVRLDEAFTTSDPLCWKADAGRLVMRSFLGRESDESSAWVDWKLGYPERAR